MMHLSPQQLAAALGGEVSGGEVLAPGPGHSPRDRSMSIKLDASAPDGYVVHSFAGDDPLACKDYVRDRAGMPSWEPIRPRVDNIARMSDRVRKPVAKAGSAPATYIYKQADGTPYLRVVRPGFYQSHWNGTAWITGAPRSPKIPYRLPEIIAAGHDGVNDVVIVEGEKDADNLAALGFIATTNSGGAEKWTPEMAPHFADKDVYIIPDNDEPGAAHLEQVRKALSGVVRSLRVVKLPGLPDKGDVSDWLDAGGTADQLMGLMRSATSEEAPEPTKLIISSAEFIAGFVPPDYLIDGLVQRRFCYSFTAPTGSGKTAVALLLSATVALGLPIGDYFVERGRVLYLAGENPDDIRMRWLAMAEAMDFDIGAIDVHFLPGVFKLSEIASKIRDEVEKIGPVALVVVDTSAAYFEGDQENDNVQMGAHARRMRTLVTLPGEPCVLIACHPVKNAGPDNLLPRGGGAFIAEVDGNLICTKSDAVVTLHWQGKFRGPDFAPLPFHLSSATAPALKDSKGRAIPTVIAKAMSDRERSDAEANSRSDEDRLLIAINDNERASMSGLADVLGWINSKGKPDKSHIQRCAKRLKAGKYVKDERGGSLVLTEKGQTEAIRVKQNADLAGARYG